MSARDRAAEPIKYPWIFKGMGADGTKGAVGEVLGELAEQARPAEPEQLSLIGVPANMSPDRREQITAGAVRARAGRPPGAQNLATREVKDFCRRVFGYDPMVEGFRWLQHTPESLAAVLGCSRAEAFDRLEAIRKDLARYFYAPMQPVDQEGRAVPALMVAIGGQAVGAAGQRPPWQYLDAEPIEQNQGVSEAEPEVSHDGVSHGEAK